jgi:hypothetical protein
MDPGRFERVFAFRNGFLHFRMGSCISEWAAAFPNGSCNFRMRGRPSKSGRRAVASPACSRRIVPPNELSNRRIVQPKECPAEGAPGRRPLSACLTVFRHPSGHAAAPSHFLRGPSHSEMQNPIRKCKNAFGNAKTYSERDFLTPFPSGMPSPRSEWNRFHFEWVFAFRNGVCISKWVLTVRNGFLHSD